MSDLSTLLHETAGPPAPWTSTEVADAHLTKARLALRRRNARRLSVGSGFVAAAAVGIFALAGPTSAPTPPSVAPSTATSSSVKLVAYRGTQPTGFTLDKVPAGWQVDHDDLSLLTLAPVGATTVDAQQGAVSLEGRVAISTQSDTGIPSGVQLDDVQVDGRPAVIAHMQGTGDTRTLFVQQPSGTYLQIQVWGGLGWDNDEIVTFASSVHINAGAVASVG